MEPPASVTSLSSRAAAASKRSRANANGRYKASLRGASEDVDDEDDDGDDDDMGDGDDPEMDTGNTSGRRSNKKPETEEEKRKNFLERNRQGISTRRPIFNTPFLKRIYSCAQMPAA